MSELTQNVMRMIRQRSWRLLRDPRMRDMTREDIEQELAVRYLEHANGRFDESRCRKCGRGAVENVWLRQVVYQLISHHNQQKRKVPGAMNSVEQDASTNGEPLTSAFGYEALRNRIRLRHPTDAERDGARWRIDPETSCPEGMSDLDQTIWRHRMSGMTYRAIGRAVGLSYTAVRNHLKSMADAVTKQMDSTMDCFGR